MLSFKLVRNVTTAIAGVVFASAVLPVWASHTQHTARLQKSTRKALKHSAITRSHGSVSSRPRAIDDARASEIQGALMKAGYLQSASGHWDDASADAMRKMQADNGWQTKLIPDSRALIKLGLGANSGGAVSDGSNNLITPVE